MNKLVFVFGRMNPPHLGHDKMITYAETLAHMNNSDFKIVLTKTSDNQKNPLSYSQKSDIFTQLYGRNILGEHENHELFKVLEDFDKEYDSITLVVGGDQYAVFKPLFEKYQKDYIAKIEVHNFASRDRYNISASEMRQFAKDNNFEMFNANCPPHMTQSAKLETFRSVKMKLYNERSCNTNGSFTLN